MTATPTPTHVLTLRLDEDLARRARFVAQVDGISFSELVRRAIADYNSKRGADQAFIDRVRDRVELDEAILRRLT